MEQLGARVFDFRSGVEFQRVAFMRPFIDACFEERAELKRNGRKLQANVVKLTMNVQYGKSVQDQECFRNTTVFTDPLKFAKKVAGANMLDMHIQIAENGGFLGLVDTAKGKSAVLRSVPQVGLKTLEEAHLMLFLYHYDVRKVFDGPSSSTRTSTRTAPRCVPWSRG